MNIRNDDLRRYLETLNSVLRSTADEHLPPDARNRLLHLALLPARIVGYVSTKFGLAVEYVKAEETSILITSGSARVEELLLGAGYRLRKLAIGVSVRASNATFSNPVFTSVFPFRLETPEASVRLENAQCTHGEWKRTIAYAEVYADRSAVSWSVQNAVARAKDEVLLALVDLQRAQSRKMDLAEYVAAFKQKTVLVLGAYDVQGLERLRAVSTVLSQMGYDPVLLKDIPDHPHHDLHQKAVTFGAVARFVFVDDASASGHLTEVEICRNNYWVTVLLRPHGTGASRMTSGASIQSRVILEEEYDPDDPAPAIHQAVAWAESTLQTLSRQFNGIYPWRNVGA